MRVYLGTYEGAAPLGADIQVASRYYPADGYYYRDSDPVVTLMTHSLLPLGYHSLGSLCYATREEPAYHNVLVDKPFVHENHDRYINAFNAFSVLTKALDSTLRLHVKPPRENMVFHMSSRGDCTPEITSSYRADDTPEMQSWVSLFPNWYAPRLVPSLYADASQIHRSLGSFVPMMRAEAARPRPLVFDSLEYIQAQIESPGGFGGTVSYYGYWSYARVHSLEWELTNDGVLIVDYDMTWNFSNSSSDVVYNPMWGWTYSNRITITPVWHAYRGLSPMNDGETRDIVSPYDVTSVLRCTTTSVYGWSSYGGYTPQVGQVDTHTRISSTAYLYDFPRTSTASEVVNVKSRIDLTSEYSSLKVICKDYLEDFRGATFLSASDALENFGEDYANNTLETLGELGSLLSFLPDLRETLQAIRAAKTGRFLEAAKHFVKNSASEYLRFVFGTAPNVDLLINQLPSLGNVIDSFSAATPTDKLTTYGSYSFQLPSDKFGIDTTLVVRTKIAMVDYPSEPLRTLLLLQRLGLAPTTSNLWETISMSFVADWFLSLGKAFRAIENSLALSAMSIDYYVHSYTVVHRVSEGEMQSMGVTPIGPDLTYRCYAREWSYVTPTLRSSRLAFFVPQVLPNWATPLALLISRT